MEALINSFCLILAMTSFDGTQPITYKDLHCTSCSNWLKLDYVQFNEKLDGVQISVNKLPMLVCPSCSKTYFPFATQLFLLDIIEQAHKKGEDSFNGTRRISQPKFNYCRKTNFEYDAADYVFIPGLTRPEMDGALTPIFFDKKVLQKFRSDPDYTVDQFSDTCGIIRYGEQWNIAYGITRSNKVICWIYDLDKLSESEQQYFKAFNVPSDHDIGSAFYDAQIEVKWASLSDETKLFQQINAINKLLKMKCGIMIFKEPDPDKHQSINKPIFWDAENVLPVINSLNQICVESIIAHTLKSEITKNEPEFSTVGLKGLKLLEKWIEMYCLDLNAKSIMKPLFVLYDFRKVLIHDTGSNEESILQSCYERMNVLENSFEKLHNSIIKEISNSLDKIIIATSQSSFQEKCTKPETL